MAYPSDSTIAAQPVADQYGQGTSYAALYNDSYSNPSMGAAGGDGTSTTAAAALPPYEDFSAEASAEQEQVNPLDTYVMDPAAAPGDVSGMPGDATAVPGDVSGVPGDVAAVPADGTAMQPEATTPEEALAQVEQHVRQKFDEVVQLGTATPIDEEKFGAAVTELVQTAELMGAFRAMADGGTRQPGDPAAKEKPTEEQAAVQPEGMPAEEMPAEEMPADATALQTGSADSSGAQLQVNPYEPQVPPVSSAAMAAPQAFAAAGGEELAQLQDQLGSQLTQLMSFTSATPMNTSLPSGSPLQGGNVDNFKTALLNVVKTAEQIGSVAQTSQPAQAGESVPATNIG